MVFSSVSARAPRSRVASFLATAGALTLTLVLAAPAVAAVAGPANTWTPNGSLTTARYGHMIARLADGRVLVAGGHDTADLKSVEIYNPLSGAWSGAADMGSVRLYGAAVTLASGKVLVAGGNEQDTAEVYDPAANAWAPVNGVMSSVRGNFPSATLLPSGEVLIAGGAGADATDTADRYNPVTNSFVATASMGTPRAGGHTATALANGNVLVAGGGTGDPLLSSGEVYNSQTNTWTPVSNAMTWPRAHAAAAALPNGKVLIAGGKSVQSPGTVTSSVDIYDPAANAFAAGPAMTTPRMFPGSAVLTDGRVLVFGGASSLSSSVTIAASSEIYDPATVAWMPSGSLSGERYGAAAALLANGDVLVAGGSSATEALATSERFSPGSVPTAPTNAAATAGSNATAQVTFGLPDSDGGSPILRYTITASTGRTVSVPATQVAGTVAGLTNGVPVTFTVTATNALGTGPPSAASNAVTPGPPVVAPAPPPAPPPPPPPPPPPADTKAPSVRITGMKAMLKLKSFLKGVALKLAPSEPASLNVSLATRTNKGTFARILARKTFSVSATRRSVKLVPSKKLVGSPARLVVRLRIVATDAAKNTSATSKTITVRR
jgi:hypothetical protein